MADEDIQHLYKFRSLAGESLQYVEKTLRHSDLYFPRPSEFNDPFDCLPIMSLDATDKEFLQYVENLFKRRSPQMSRQKRKAIARAALNDQRQNQGPMKAKGLWYRAMVEATNSVGVLSLAQRSDHVLMWAHYADSHKGVCLRFKASGTTPFFGRAQKVSYQSARPAVNVIRDSPQEQSEKALLTKADFWAYEQEWRIVDHENGPGVHRFPPILLDGIIFGARIPDHHKQHIASLAEARADPVQLYRATISPKVFGVDIDEI